MKTPMFGFTGCPCELVNPCRTSCSCANPLMSGGCARCAKYGNLEQRVKAAERLVHQEIYAGIGEHLFEHITIGGNLKYPTTFLGNCIRWCREANEMMTRVTTCRKPLEDKRT